MTILAWINNQTNICENTSYDIRPASEIQIEGYTIIDLDQTESVGWEWDATIDDYVMVAQNLGEGGINDTYVNGKLVEPKPTTKPIQQPVTTGTEEV